MTEQDKGAGRVGNPVAGRPEQRPYEQPRISVLGTVEDMTRDTNPGNQDFDFTGSIN